MIILSGQTPIGEGAEKIVFRHPENPRLVVKAVKAAAMERIKRRKPVRSFVLGEDYYNPARREYRRYRHAFAAKRAAVLRHIPQCYGIAETDKGEAVLSEMIRRADGSPAPTLDRYVEEAGGVCSSLRTAVQEFVECVRGPYWECCDFHCNNILVAETRGGGVRLMYCEYFYQWWNRKYLQFYHRRKVDKKLRAHFMPRLQKYGAELRAAP